jgi:hypothetical protein
VKLAIDHLDTDIEMVIGQDMIDLGSNGLNDGIEIELACQQSGNIQIAVKLARWC